MTDLQPNAEKLTLAEWLIGNFPPEVVLKRGTDSVGEWFTVGYDGKRYFVRVAEVGER